MKKKFVLLFLLFVTLSCGKKEEEKVKYVPTLLAEWEMSCLRWVDRKIFFSNSSTINDNRNNSFDQKTVKDVISALEVNTRLGEDYFNVSKYKDEQLLQPIRSSNLQEKDYDSFILIWEDAKFDKFVNDELGGFANVSDRNAITILNNKYRRKFYMILRASCFDGEVGYQCGQIGVGGLNALIARQFGYMLQMQPANCDVSPNSVLCPIAKDAQWSTENREEFYQAMTSHLINIENNSNFYNDADTKADCLTKSWMDRDLTAGSPDGSRNNTFFVQDVFESLDEIACSTMLGCNYFTQSATTESNIPIYLERVENLTTKPKSYLMIWPDTGFNSFVTESGFTPADPNGIVFINKAHKKNYNLILRSSCFDSNNEFCDGGNGGITRNGLNALIARQYGLMVGLKPKDCSIDPNHVMCTELPSDLQWTPTAKTRFFNQFNNALEYLGNNKDFYYEYVIEIDIKDK